MIEWWQALIGLLGVLGIRELLAKLIDRKASSAAIDKIRVEVKASEVEILRDVLVEVRAADSEKSVRLERLEERMALLEDRERHQLTRAAVHEAWDQMSWTLLLQHSPNHPPPPPLIDRGELQSAPATVTTTTTKTTERPS